MTTHRSSSLVATPAVVARQLEESLESAAA
jgi:hypothetical protein